MAAEQPPLALDSDAYVAIAQCFELTGPLVRLSGGEGRTLRAGSRIYRLEGSPAEAAYIAELYDALPERGFRLPRPIRCRDGAWISPQGWSAWTCVAGRPATSQDLPQLIPAIQAFHQALAHLPYPEYLARRDSPYDRADRQAWGELPAAVDARLEPFLRLLARRRKRLPELPSQLIHGDLNEENILVAPGLPPALIDMTPYWHPPEFALAVLAYWLGPYRGDESILQAFAHLPGFDQLLVRVGLRSVLISHEFSRLGASLDGAAAEFECAVGVITRWVDRADPPG